ncbi:enoyl-CoA hydratase/isomerase family protein [Candidatus Binatus sp.]|uniref:enoyl-CoA hydratase/isomerase family protein n=2 Tax=Candidatus Binatus sp. TaxID=2811406 RepID=UPI003CC52C13
MFEPKYGDVSVKLDGNVATLEIHRPPHNFFDFNLIHDLADAFESLDQTPECRALLLCSEGKSFCAGANFANRDAQSGEAPARPGENPLYIEGVRLFRCKKPVVAAVQGAAIGGGFGLALVADFRVATPDSRFAANFVKLGIHPGFGLTHTLPRLIGVQKASLMFYTGRRIDGKEALAMGLCDQLVEPDDLRNSALALAKEIAEGAPLALLSTRATMRQGLADAVKTQTDHEFKEQSRLFKTEDHREGVKAVTERRPGKFLGK